MRGPEVREEDLNDVERQSVTCKPPYIKLKIDIDTATCLPNIRLYDRVEDVCIVIIIEKLKDLTDHMRYLSKVRFNITIHKLYLMKTQIGDKKNAVCVLRYSRQSVRIKLANNMRERMLAL